MKNIFKNFKISFLIVFELDIINNKFNEKFFFFFFLRDESLLVCLQQIHRTNRDNCLLTRSNQVSKLS